MGAPGSPTSMTTLGPIAGTNPVGCWLATVWVTKKSIAGTNIWRHEHIVSWCAAQGRITQLRSRKLNPIILNPAVLQFVYTWRGELKAESFSTPVVGAASAVSYGKHQFEMCGVFKVGPLCNTDEVDSEITFTAKGGATCKSSAGPVRNCVIRTV